MKLLGTSLKDKQHFNYLDRRLPLGKCFFPGSSCLCLGTEAEQATAHWGWCEPGNKLQAADDAWPGKPGNRGSQEEICAPAASVNKV